MPPAIESHTHRWDQNLPPSPPPTLASRLAHNFVTKHFSSEEREREQLLGGVHAPPFPPLPPLPPLVPLHHGRLLHASHPVEVAHEAAHRGVHGVESAHHEHTVKHVSLVEAPSDAQVEHAVRARCHGAILCERTPGAHGHRPEEELLLRERYRPKQWQNPIFGSFDDFGSAMLLLYVLSTGDGWDQVMFYGMDTREPGFSPVRNDTSALSLYFILWMFVGSFFALNLFVGVVVDNFNRIKAVKDGSAHLTEAQAQWVDTMKVSMGQKPKLKFRAKGFLGGLLFPIMQVTHPPPALPQPIWSIQRLRPLIR